jgi:hypothetical protein
MKSYGDTPDIGGSLVVELFDIAGRRWDGGGTLWYAPLAVNEPGYRGVSDKDIVKTLKVMAARLS